MTAESKEALVMDTDQNTDSPLSFKGGYCQRRMLKKTKVKI
jgi:hypothetical protein